MFFSKLNQVGGGKNPNHPSNAKNVVNKITSTKVVTTVKVQNKSSKPTSVSASPRPSPPDSRKLKNDVSRSPVRVGTKRTARAMVHQSDDEEDEGEDNWDLNIKRLASSSKEGTPGLILEDNRKMYIGDEVLRITSSNSLDSTTIPETIIHAANVILPADYSPIFETLIEFTFQLPFGYEKYKVSRPKRLEDTDFMHELDTVMEMVAAELVPSQYSVQIKDPNMRDCIVRRARRAVQGKDQEKFLASINEYNELMINLRKEGELKKKLESMSRLPAYITVEFLNQVYRRVVSPRSQELRDYKAFSNNVYGELLPSFVSRIFRQTGLVSKSVFVDLGSGVGNCVLQAALEVGCESWGCEIMKTASELAELQKNELESRLKLYGIKAGPISVRSADFVNNSEIQAVIQRADTVLVNNYAFSPELNGSLVDMFLDLKDGCKIVSLKSFVPPGHTISEYNIESPLNILDVESYQFGDDSVSWTTVGGDYYISTVNRSRLSDLINRV
jgi:[histone H3]-lysine79 N-trimethyltransferase